MSLRSLVAVAFVALAWTWPLCVQADASPTHGISVSFDFHRLPHRQDVHFAPLTRTDLAKLRPDLRTKQGILQEAGHALTVARKEFGFSLRVIDRRVGIVAAVVDPILHPMLRHMPAWVITADVETKGTNPATEHIVYRRLCVVVNIQTGAYRYAYTADPHQRTSIVLRRIESASAIRVLAGDFHWEAPRLSGAVHGLRSWKR